MISLSRRNLLSTLAGSGALAIAIPSAPALAFSEQTATSREQTLHDNACGATASHQQLVQEVEKTLGDKVSDDDKKAVIAQLTCPVCGCPLGGLF